MRSTLLRRLGLVVAGSAAILATALSLSVPAQASQSSTDSVCHAVNGLSKDGSFVIAERELICPDEEKPGNVTLQQKNSSGVFVDVASGLGIAAFHCTGTASRTYKIASTSVVRTFACS
jgi:hypothetical protein